MTFQEWNPMLRNLMFVTAAGGPSINNNNLETISDGRI